MSAPSLHMLSTKDITAEGVSNAADARATCRFLRLLCRTLGPRFSRIRTRITVEFEFTSSTNVNQERRSRMRKTKTAIIGTGFMGKVHAEQVRRLGHVEIAAVASATDQLAKDFGDAIGVDRTTGDYKTILSDPTIEPVHVLVPNAWHHPISKAAVAAGKHVLCEKPFTVSVAEARELVALAAKTGKANGLEHNLRYYPVVQHMRRMIEAGDLGEILIVQGTYSKDWLLYVTDWN